jgi:hypothetical protein
VIAFGLAVLLLLSPPIAAIAIATHLDRDGRCPHP